MQLLLVLAFLLLPAFVLWLVHRFAWARNLGTIVLCYALGLIVGNLGLLPASFAPAQSTLLEVTIALALPLILLTVDVRAWSRIAGKALASMALAVLSVLIVSTGLFFVYRHLGTDKAYELAGLSVGIYTGGTPNLAAIKTALGVADARYLLFNAFDVAVGALYLLFMVTVAKAFFGRFLPAYVAPRGPALEVPIDTHDEDYASLLHRRGLARVAQSLGVALLVVGLAVGLSTLLGAGNSPAVVIALLTSFALMASLLAPVRRLAESYKAGMYLIYVFSFTVASLAQFTTLADLDLSLLLFVVVAVSASMGLHALFCWLAKIDVDTFLVTSMSTICSPPFVPMMARSLGNQAVLLSGIATGIIGYAVGTYLGIALALLLKNYF